MAEESETILPLTHRTVRQVKAKPALAESPEMPVLAPTEAAGKGIFVALRHTDYRKFWIGNLLSNVGNWMQTVGQGWLVLQLTNSPFWLGVVGFAATIPSLAFSPLGGILADRADRRRMMIVMQTTMSIEAISLGLLVTTGHATVLLVTVLAFVNGVASSLSSPSYQALVPQMVPRQDIAKAVALNTVQFNLARVVGPSLAGLVLAYWGAAACFYVNAASYLAFVFALATLRIPANPYESDATWVEHFSAGLRYVTKHTLMWVLLLSVAAAGFFGMPYIVLMPVMARDVLRVGETGLGYLFAATGIGAVLGAMGISFWERRPHRAPVVLVGAAIFSISLLGFSQATMMDTAFLSLMLLGAALITFVGLVNTLLQLNSSDQMRGRVMGMYILAWQGMVPLGNLLSGWIAEHYGTRLALALGGGMCLTTIAFLALALPAIRRRIRTERQTAPG